MLLAIGIGLLGVSFIVTGIICAVLLLFGIYPQPAFIFCVVGCLVFEIFRRELNTNKSLDKAIRKYRL